jgi:tRNA-dihydrouridine synthase 2
MRALAVEMGASMVYSEEIVDKKIIKTLRSENVQLGTVDYSLPSAKSDSDGPIVFRTYRDEKVVFQVGTADATLALQAANHIARDVRAFDVNMGCPKHFSISGGMGAALLSKPDVVEDILKTLKRNLNIPVTCKIRLLDSEANTVEFMRRIEKCEVNALAVHARHIPDRSSYAAAIDELASTIRAANLSIPIIHNADIFRFEEIEQMKKTTGAQSVMIARGAQWNASVFRREGPLPVYDIMQRYLDLAVKYDNHPKNTKYALVKMIECQGVKGIVYDSMNRAKTNAELQEALNGLSKERALIRPYEVPIELKDRSLMVPEPIGASKKKSKKPAACGDDESKDQSEDSKPAHKKQRTQ